MKNKEFLEFLTGHHVPPAFLREATQKEIFLSFHKKSILSRFLAYQTLGALLSLALCPQFGLGLVDGHGITHYFRLISETACAAFCGSLFLSSGMLLAFMAMKAEELWWIWNRYKFVLILLPALLWGGLMFSSWSLNLPRENFSYHLVWIILAQMVLMLWMKLSSQTYIKKMRTRKS